MDKVKSLLSWYTFKMNLEITEIPLDNDIMVLYIYLSKLFG